MCLNFVAIDVQLKLKKIKNKKKIIKILKILIIKVKNILKK